MSKTLTFREDGTFKILQFTDVHIGDGVDGRDKDAHTVALMERLIEQERPDLIVYTGDLCWSHGVKDPEQGFRRAISPAVKSGLPWAAVFGNHDTEEGVTREQLMDVMLESDTCLAEPGPEHLSGVGNYMLPIQSAGGGKVKALLYFLDSGCEAPKHIGGYEWIHGDQVEWYAGVSKEMTAQHGSPLPALTFFHIPLPEYDAVWHTGSVISGSKFERVCAPKMNSGLYARMVEMGDVMATFVGHDHDNDYIGELHGISLCYGRTTGYNCYGKLQRGARVIQLIEGTREFHTWLRLENGTVLK
ncbi:metallophosphoesterase family protein [Paenibacillus sp. MER TA 81-3]|uniref:metallophosphoesterase family protein n=1 Tax=Paenibacillus sp. MER TA 81-3 TaxID=2939573 RepID=UPI00203AA91D|nr:metallophosphoesterase family protein [Paenibacillus sp. MER TA 81-3]MCM3337529.1 metallophosphoesterase family protein [Paenibacillus sp. MER TA 81-3]